MLSKQRKAILTLQAQVLITTLGIWAAAPEWAAEQLVYALVVGVSGNVVERLSGTVAAQAHDPRDLDDQRKFYLTFWGQILLFILGVRAGWSADDGPPEWAAQWLVLGLAAGTGANVLEHLTATWARINRRKTADSVPGIDAVPVPVLVSEVPT